jgi:hypothetical protein
MTDTGTELHEGGPELRVRFGPHPNQTIPVEWAESILSALAGGTNAQRSKFGKLLASAALNNHISNK